MYKMTHFTEADHDNVIAFMNAHPLVTLIGNDGINSAATQVPVIVEENKGVLKLRGHVMRKTDHHLALEKNNKVLVLFTGAQCYVSASWYSERGHGSTWNYMTVHARGTINFLNDEQTIKILTDLTHQFEDKQEHPELLENMTHEYVHSLVNAIAGFEIVVENLHPIFKLSQNQDDEGYQRIVEKLSNSSDHNAQEIARQMKKRREKLFAEQNL